MIRPEIKDVEGVVAVADIDPHLPRPCLARNQRVEDGHLGGVGVKGTRLTYQGRHEIGDGPKHAGDVGHPVAGILEFKTLLAGFIEDQRRHS
jgi:hypothetical protein